MENVCIQKISAQSDKGLLYSTELKTSDIILLFILTGGLVLCFNQVASAKERKFPARPVTVINAFQPGGGTDVELRNISPHIQKHLGQPIVIRSIPGGGSTLAAMAASKAKPDGYTLLCANIPTMTLPQEFHGTDSRLETFEYIYAWFAGPNDVTVGVKSRGLPPLEKARSMPEYFEKYFEVVTPGGEGTGP